jgi:hypothetical protein
VSIFTHDNLEDTDVSIFDEFMVNPMHQGAIITPAHNEKLEELIAIHFTNKLLAYISNRCFAYAANLLTYAETFKIHNLLGIAIVSKNQITIDNALLEKNIYARPFVVFRSLSEVMAWVQNVILVAAH